MITATFFQHAGCFCGFSVTGHAGYDDAGRDIVCSAVTSAVQMTSNALTEVLGLCTKVQVDDNCITVRLEQQSSEAENFLKALLLHLSVIGEDYEDTVQTIVREV